MPNILNRCRTVLYLYQLQHSLTCCLRGNVLVTIEWKVVRRIFFVSLLYTCVVLIVLHRPLRLSLRWIYETWSGDYCWLPPRYCNVKHVGTRRVEMVWLHTSLALGRRSLISGENGDKRCLRYCMDALYVYGSFLAHLWRIKIRVPIGGIFPPSPEFHKFTSSLFTTALLYTADLRRYSVLYRK